MNMLRYFKEVLISPPPSTWRTHVFLNVNQCNCKDTEPAVVTLIAAMSGAPDTVCRWIFIVFARPPMQYQSSWDYVSSDLCAEMPRADTEPALPAKRDATCHIGAHDGEPATGSACFAGGGTPPPWAREKGSLSFCQEKLCLRRKGIIIMEVRMLWSGGSKRADSRRLFVAPMAFLWHL